MASETTTTFPLMDFTNEHLKSGTSVWNSKREQVQVVLENHSFFLVAYDQISEQLSKAAYHALEELFNLPTQKKVEFTSDKPYLGYFGQRLAFAEVIAIGDTTKMETLEGFINLMFSSEKKDYFCEIMHSYSKKVAELQEFILRMVFESYGVEKYYQSHKESTAYVCRFNKYRAPKMNESNVGMVPHTDLSFLTILHQNQVNGLELKTTDGNWIPVEFPPSSFAVVAGDALMAWSNGRIRSIVHRVTMSEEEPRYSIGMFSYKNGIVEAPKELVDEHHPLLYKPFDHFELVALTYVERLHVIEDKLKVLCGI